MKLIWPKRFTVVGLCFFGLVIAYTDRVNISIAAIEMQRSLGWTDTTKGLVLSSFFVGYILFMVAGGVLANRYGGRIVLGTGRRFVVDLHNIDAITPPRCQGRSSSAHEFCSEPARRLRLLPYSTFWPGG